LLTNKAYLDIAGFNEHTPLYAICNNSDAPSHAVKTLIVYHLQVSLCHKIGHFPYMISLAAKLGEREVIFVKCGTALKSSLLPIRRDVHLSTD
jgi:hypothetical protein